MKTYISALILMTLSLNGAIAATICETQVQGWDAKAYLDCNTDVRDAHMDPCDHYIQYGKAEQRRWSCTANNTPEFAAQADCSWVAGHLNGGGTIVWDWRQAQQMSRMILKCANSY